jgi:hypothetical protein
MEDSLTWLTAGLVFIGIIVQQDARGAVSRPTPLMTAEQPAQILPGARFLKPLQERPYCQAVSLLGSREGDWQACMEDGVYLCANAPQIGLDVPVRACVPGSGQHARLSTMQPRES